MLVQGQPLDDIAVGIGHDAQKSEMELAAEEGERFIHATMRRQGVPADGKAARAQLLAKMKIKGGCRAEPGRA